MIMPESEGAPTPPISTAALDPAIGTGNWKAYTLPLDRIYDAAAQWKLRLEGVERPWLCWNVSHPWSVLQQKMVRKVGWTPVVGFDPRVGMPPLEPGAIGIDFNADFQFPVMWPHFPLEFAFLFAPRLAFWHADLLVRLPLLEELAAQFSALAPGTMAAVLDKGGLRNSLNFKTHRFWELIGCTTAEASADQFRRGAGWWRNFQLHPSCTDPAERTRRSAYSYDSGVGILYWRNVYKGTITDVGIRRVKERHCSEIGAAKYIPGPNHTNPGRNLSSELEQNYSLDEVAQRMGLGAFL
jgi:hypothetical protein